MIFGKTYRERRAAEQKQLQNLRDGLTNGWPKFAFWPTTLQNGQKIWLETYYEFVSVLGEGKSLWLNKCAFSYKPIKYRYRTREEGL